MVTLITKPNLTTPDDLYERLITLHDGHSEAESLKIWARAFLTLANHVGDEEVINQAIDLASVKY